MAKIDYYEKDGGIKYVYPSKSNEGDVLLWSETDLSKFKELEFTKHCDDRLRERGLSRDIVVRFFNEALTKIAWVPDYNSDNGMNVRVVGKLNDVGFLTVITAIDLGPHDEIEIFTAHKIGDNKIDLDIWKAGMERIAQLEEKNVVTE
jgi:hypothetical protein